MGFLSKETVFDVPYSIDDCFEAMKLAVSSLSKFSLKRENRLVGTLEVNVSAGMTSFTFGDIIAVSISQSATASSRISISSTAKVPSVLASVQESKNVQALVERFTREIGYFTKLDASPQTTPTGSDGVKERLTSLEALLSSGLITQVEYEKKRSEILASL